jgi:cellulose biosynthesis protein BcsQ
MQLVVIDVTPQLRATLLGRVQEASRQAGMQRLAVVEVDPLNLDEVNWGATIGIFIGVGCGSMIKELLSKLQGSGSECALSIVLDADTYAAEAVAIHKILGRVVICETDLTQMATFIVDCERLATGRPLGVRARHIVGVAQFKGGVGVSTLTASLGVCLARQGRSVAIVDFDDVSPQITEWARVGMSQRMLVGELLRGGEVTTDRLRDFISPVDGFEGRLVVVGQPYTYSEGFHLKSYVLEGSPSASIFVNSLLSLLSTEYEIVLIDLGRSWGVATFTALPWCEKVALVIDDDGLSVRRSVDGLARLKQESGDPDEFNLAKWSVVFNKITGNRLAARDLAAVIDEAEIFPKQPQIYPINFSEKGRQWGGVGETMYDLASEAVRQQISKLANGLAPNRSSESAQQRRNRLQRVFDWFVSSN